MSYGLKVSKAGFDVKTTAVKNQIFNSDYNKFKILAQGSVNISVGAVAGQKYSTTIAHGLSYTPTHLAFFQHRDATKSYLATGNNGDGLDGYGYGTTDATNLNLNIISNGTAYTATIYYYLFANPGS